MRPHPRMAETDPFSPRAWATCDRCGFVTNLYKLAWQYDWRGTKLDNTRVLVCNPCYDDPQRQLGVVFIPPDPLPKVNARVEQYQADEQPVSTRYTMNGIARAVRYRPYPSLRIVNCAGNVPTTSLSPLPVPVGFKWVQGGITINGGVSSSTCVVTLPSRVGIGNLLCVSVSFGSTVSTDSVSVTDDKGNSYSPVDTVFQSANQYVLYTFYILNVSNSPLTITATDNTSSPPFMTMIIDEFSIGATATLDGHSGQAQLSPTGTNAVSSGNYTTSKNGDLIWGVMVSINSAGVVPGTAFKSGIANNRNASFTTEYEIQSSSGSVAALGTLVAPSNTVAASLAFSHS